MDALIFGLQVTLVGVGLVFVALTSLIFVIFLMEKVMAGFNKKPENKVEPAKAVPAPVVKAPVVAAQEDNQEELIAVIAAAISAYGGGQVHVKSIKRLQGSPGAPWAQAGRADYMNLKQMV